MATFRKRGLKWQVQVRRKGLCPLSRSFHVLKDAQTWARSLERDADRGELPPNARVLQGVTLGDLVRRYRDTVSPTKPTGTTERLVLSAFLRRPICSKRLSELRTADFATYRDQRLREIKVSSLKRELAPVRHLFEIARAEWGLPLRSNPLTGLSLVGVDQRRERRLKNEELRLLLGAANGSKNRLLVPIIMFALVTAMRRGEILALKWCHVDRATRCVLIPTSKTGYARTIPLVDEAIAILDGLPHSSDLVFPMSANALRLAWNRIRAKAGSSDLHFHDLRHESISRFFEAGLSTMEVALISGHRDARMLFRYTHPIRERIAAQLTGNKLIGPLAPE